MGEVTERAPTLLSVEWFVRQCREVDGLREFLPLRLS